ncbi:MAG TPA: hypothetical protein VFL57_20670, partial [Bryobacteraceae bacterium]|nr:hypothetical protein [Bryobacteraceae bacterium]
MAEPENASTFGPGAAAARRAVARPAGDPLSPGQLLCARFRILRRVGHGGMGFVYEAFDEKLNRRVALKCARTGYAQRLSPEVRLASEVSHPNVCRIFEIHTDVTPDGPIDFVTMEFLEGETLSRRLAGGKLPEKEARSIALQPARDWRKRTATGSFTATSRAATSSSPADPTARRARSSLISAWRAGLTTVLPWEAHPGTQRPSYSPASRPRSPRTSTHSVSSCTNLPADFAPTSSPPRWRAP